MSIAPLLRPVVPLVYRMAASSSGFLMATVWRSLQRAAASSSVPVRSSSSVNTWRVPAASAMGRTQAALRPVHTTTAGSALPMKYSISALW
ncbi:hypothetical protein D9M72_190410 [compost metagenome]